MWWHDMKVTYFSVCEHTWVLLFCFDRSLMGLGDLAEVKI